jgi:hypothetical protein
VMAPLSVRPSSVVQDTIDVTAARYYPRPLSGCQMREALHSRASASKGAFPHRSNPQERTPRAIPLLATPAHWPPAYTAGLHITSWSGGTKATNQHGRWRRKEQPTSSRGSLPDSLVAISLGTSGRLSHSPPVSRVASRADGIRSHTEDRLQWALNPRRSAPPQSKRRSGPLR